MAELLSKDHKRAEDEYELANFIEALQENGRTIEKAADISD